MSELVDGMDHRDELIRRLVDCLEMMMPFAYTGAATRDIDPADEPKFVHACATLGFGKLFLESKQSDLSLNWDTLLV